MYYNLIVAICLMFYRQINRKVVIPPPIVFYENGPTWENINKGLVHHEKQDENSR